jgi:hypothetical protein
MPGLRRSTRSGIVENQILRVWDLHPTPGIKVQDPPANEHDASPGILAT